MTREEAIRLLDLNREYLKNTNNIGLKDDIEALDMAIKALEEKPKTGRWLSSTIQGEIDGQIVKSFICSECGAISVFRMSGGIIVNGNLCPNCGAKMEEYK